MGFNSGFKGLKILVCQLEYLNTVLSLLNIQSKDNSRVNYVTWKCKYGPLYVILWKKCVSSCVSCYVHTREQQNYLELYFFCQSVR